jgi:hypothetical protein
MADSLVMQRSVAQLLFHYLPGRLVDWEGGLVITQLTNVHFSSVWAADRAAIVLEELAIVFDRWKRNGEVDRLFPNPRLETGQYTVGTPESIEAIVLETGVVCPRCSRLKFINFRDLTNDDDDVLTCPSCQRKGMKQIGQIFVHGCGEFAPIKLWMPATRNTASGAIEATSHPLKCPRCKDKGELFFPNRTDRLKDMYVECRRCKTMVKDRLTARCTQCLRDFNNLSDQARESAGDTLVSRIAMRMTRYSASAAYYPQHFSILRLDRPAVNFYQDDELTRLEQMLPETRRANQEVGAGSTIELLGRKLKDAERVNDTEEIKRIRALIANAVLEPPATVAVPEMGGESMFQPSADDLERAIVESIAFRTTVDSRNVLDVASTGQGASSFLVGDVRDAISRMRISEIRLVNDLPIISATFGFTRRTFEQTYEELSATLPTRIRPFTPVDQYEAQRQGRPESTGTVPILAREGDHEGLFISLPPEHVAEWLTANEIELPLPGQPPIVRIMLALENVDRYYDNIWTLRLRRMVFGLIHTLSHAAMRAASRFTGVEKTAISEYIFLPLLGTVIYDGSSSFKLGGFETMVRDRLFEFISALSDDALSCLYDSQCIDHKGACHGCVHSPEISCRVFNHGLSRAFLIGGHSPWLDISDHSTVRGYWESND